MYSKTKCEIGNKMSHKLGTSRIQIQSKFETNTKPNGVSQTGFDCRGYNCVASLFPGSPQVGTAGAAAELLRSCRRVVPPCAGATAKH
jgi:hypothetical protein